MASKAEDILTAWADFFVAHALATREIESQLKGAASLTLDEYDLLLTISRQPQHQMRFKALGEATIYTKSGITRIAQRMEDAGYIRRTECPDDKRGSFAVLTDVGKKALQETWKHYSRAVLNIFEDALTQAESKQLAELLGKIVDRLRPDSIVQIGRSCTSLH
jgi:DNA-binding MarR family transcriptional regulator